MKKNLLLFCFAVLFGLSLQAQNSDCDQCPYSDNISYTDNNTAPAQKPVTQPANNRVKRISVYPNPASDYFALTDATNVNQIFVFNILGRKVRSFKIENHNKYNISELPRGRYLVQLVDSNNKIVTTQRLNKK